MSEMEQNERDGLFSKSVRAGKRTYFFDVRSTRSNDYYLSITESKRRFGQNENEKPFFEKHKIFLYREDFEKFMDAISEAMNYIGDNAPPMEPRQQQSENSDSNNGYNSDVSFDDLK